MYIILVAKKLARPDRNRQAEAKGKKMKHEIVKTQEGITETVMHGLTKKEAVREIKKLVYNNGKNNNYQYYIECYRASDGQHMHLNHDGYAITGTAWND